MRHTHAGTKPQNPLRPSAGLQLAFGSALFTTYALFFFLVRWIIVSTHLVSNLLLPAFVALSSTFIRTSISCAIARRDAGAIGDISAQTLIASMSLFYFIAIYIVSSVMSVVAQFGSSLHPYNNEEPRLHKNSIQSGLAHRVIATHDGLYDIFPAIPSLALHIVTKLGV
ncbi:hypothetical protein BJ138DRAFT_462389 [Hygrophoropsis aurantiaca]|uniref:Uncharacterized protein n=1 Tax=Hygrophoropsis aurantiaca TaxID=72124 RepID=A0ACB8ATS2_9AGAM|nr:hypothetical protein BJ138DRAFT_462389 [Hygrophoropsis aurantiaca]